MADPGRYRSCIIIPAPRQTWPWRRHGMIFDAMILHSDAKNAQSPLYSGLRDYRAGLMRCRGRCRKARHCRICNHWAAPKIHRIRFQFWLDLGVASLQGSGRFSGYGRKAFASKRSRKFPAPEYSMLWLWLAITDLKQRAKPVSQDRYAVLSRSRPKMARSGDPISSRAVISEDAVNCRRKGERKGCNARTSEQANLRGEFLFGRMAGCYMETEPVAAKPLA